jgi:hypothetical protein
LIVLLSGCLKTEYPNEKECNPYEYPFEVSADHEENRKTFARFSEREEIGRYFAPTKPSRIKWSFKESLQFGEDELPLEYSEDESRWIVQAYPEAHRVGTLTLLSNECWGYWRLLLEMENGERGEGTLRY